MGLGVIGVEEGVKMSPPLDCDLTISVFSHPIRVCAVTDWTSVSKRHNDVSNFLVVQKCVALVAMSKRVVLSTLFRTVATGKVMPVQITTSTHAWSVCNSHGRQAPATFLTLNIFHSSLCAGWTRSRRFRWTARCLLLRTSKWLPAVHTRTRSARCILST